MTDDFESGKISTFIHSNISLVLLNILRSHKRSQLKYGKVFEQLFLKLEDMWRNHFALESEDEREQCLLSGCGITCLLLHDEKVVVSNIGAIQCIIHGPQNDMEILSDLHRLDNSREKTRFLRSCNISEEEKSLNNRFYTRIFGSDSLKQELPLNSLLSVPSTSITNLSVNLLPSFEDFLSSIRLFLENSGMPEAIATEITISRANVGGTLLPSSSDSQNPQHWRHDRERTYGATSHLAVQISVRNNESPSARCGCGNCDWCRRFLFTEYKITQRRAVITHGKYNEEWIPAVQSTSQRKKHTDYPNASRRPLSSTSYKPSAFQRFITLTRRLVKMKRPIQTVLSCPCEQRPSSTNPPSASPYLQYGRLLRSNTSSSDSQDTITCSSCRENSLHSGRDLALDSPPDPMLDGLMLDGQAAFQMRSTFRRVLFYNHEADYQVQPQICSPLLTPRSDYHLSNQASPRSQPHSTRLESQLSPRFSSRSLDLLYDIPRFHHFVPLPHRILRSYLKMHTGDGRQRNDFSLQEAEQVAPYLTTCTILLASESIWDAFTYDQASAIVFTSLLLYKDPDDAAHELCRRALEINPENPVACTVLWVRRNVDAVLQSNSFEITYDSKAVVRRFPTQATPIQTTDNFHVSDLFR